MTIEQWLDNDQLGIDIWRNKYCVNNETLDEWFDRVSGGDEELKQLIIQKKFLFGGRILAGRGIDEGKRTLSNCYVTSVDDSIESIFVGNGSDVMNDEEKYKKRVKDIIYNREIVIEDKENEY